jgi:hypothetical protein
VSLNDDLHRISQQIVPIRVLSRIGHDSGVRKRFRVGVESVVLPRFLRIWSQSVLRPVYQASRNSVLTCERCLLATRKRKTDGDNGLQTTKVELF